MKLQVPWLPADPQAPFPDPHGALREPDGLLAVGGDLTPARLLNSYRHGIFPWYAEGQPILWWSPDPRMVFRTDGVHLSRRTRRELRKLPWTITSDTTFERVIRHCATSPRPGQSGTWITPAMHTAYVALHELGHAHSIEVWHGAVLVGGLYGVAIGQMFFAESMFSNASGGSKVALMALAQILRQRGWPLIDAQVESRHLIAMGAETVKRDLFLAVVERQTSLPSEIGKWTATVGDGSAAGVNTFLTL